jgi:hypothetical protein
MDLGYVGVDKNGKFYRKFDFGGIGLGAAIGLGSMPK